MIPDKNYHEDLNVDLNHLEDEWARQPHLYFQYAELAAQAQRDRDLAKENIDFVKSQQDKAIRTDPAKFGIIKITEAAVDAAIVQTQEYKVASTCLIEANYRLNLIQSMVRSLDHKKKALEISAQLWIGDYWSTPKEPITWDGQPKSLRKVSQDDATIKQRESLQRHRRK
ncbi:MAG: hypothetical protein KKH61_21570 [Gammaproteobacteria bacterium]|nr:hypothetical protein [Gammaproteobacteria bacterium]